MKYLLLLFSVLCREGTIWEASGESTDLIGGGGQYDLEYDNGVYLYVSDKKDSVFFIVEDSFYYLSGDKTKFQCLTNL